jgi:hypothetical protein
LTDQKKFITTGSHTDQEVLTIVSHGMNKNVISMPTVSLTRASFAAHDKAFLRDSNLEILKCSKSMVTCVRIRGEYAFNIDITSNVDIGVFLL